MQRRIYVQNESFFFSSNFHEILKPLSSRHLATSLHELKLALILDNAPLLLRLYLFKPLLLFLYKPWRLKDLFQFEIAINVLVSSFRTI